MRLIRGSSGRGFVRLLSGTVGAQLVTLATLPLLSRMYGPAAFGYLALVTSLAGVVGPMASLKFDNAAMLPPEQKRAVPLAWNALLSSVVVCVVFGVGLWIADLVGVGDLQEYPIVYVWAPLIALATSLYMSLSQLALRDKQYALIARRSFSQSTVTAVSKIGLGLMSAQGPSLILGALLGRMWGIATVARRVGHYFSRSSIQDLLAGWRDYWRFPTLFTASSLLNSLGIYLPTVYFTVALGAALGGQVGMASTVVTMPMALVGNTVSQLVDAEFSEVIRKRRPGLARKYLRYSAALTALSLVVLVVFTLFGPVLVPWVLGSEWELAGTAVQIMAVTASVRLVASPVSKVLVLLQHSWLTLGLDVLRVALIGLGIAASSGLELGFELSLWSVYGALAVTYAVTWFVALAVVRRRDARLVPPGSEV